MRGVEIHRANARAAEKIDTSAHSGDNKTIEMTSDGLTLLASAIRSWLAGAEDFGVSSRKSKPKPKQLGKLDRESGELWFWGPFYAGP